MFALKTGDKHHKIPMQRKLASLQIVREILPIEGADLIELALINGWQLVIKKGEFALGEMVIYCEIDSYLPISPEYEFLRKSSFKRMGELEGFRLKTIKLRGQLSQGLLLPMSILADKLPKAAYDALAEGDDVSDALGVIKYEPPIPAELSGIMKGNFPGFIPKTDEERVQNLSKEYAKLQTNTFYLTEKLDGSSATFYYNNGDFGVCSRNLDLWESADNTFWKVARELDIENKINSGNFAIQGELVGEGIQGNPYKLRGQTVYFFNAFDIDKQQYFSFSEFRNFFTRLQLKTVPVVSEEFKLPATIKELLFLAEGTSLLHPSAEREGLIIRSHDRTISFKAISNSFLLKG